MFEKVKKSISHWTQKHIEWKSARREFIELGATLFFILSGGTFFGFFVFFAGTFWYVFAGESTGGRGALFVWFVMNILLARAPFRVFFFFVSALLFLALQKSLFTAWNKKEGAREVGETALLLAFFSLASYAELGFFAFTLFVVGGVGLCIHDGLEREGLEKRRVWLSAGVSGLICGEVSLFMRYLPLEPMALSAALTLMFLTLRQIMRKSRKGELSMKHILQEILVFAVIMLSILGLASWEV
ncbi:MAG: hypothetical protein AAB634_00670 [Patescibacteria group bacterium]